MTGRERGTMMRGRGRRGSALAGVAAAVAVVLLLQPAVGVAEDLPVDSLEAREENLATVLAGLDPQEVHDANEVVATPVEDKEFSEAVPRPAAAPLGDVGTFTLGGGGGSATAGASVSANSAVEQEDQQGDQAVVGGMPVTVSAIEGAAATPEKVDVRVADQVESLAAGVTGVLLEVSDVSDVSPVEEPEVPVPPVDGSGGSPEQGDVDKSTTVQLSMSYRGFAGLAGGDWSSRLTVFEQVDCPQDGQVGKCRWVPLPSVVNDPEDQSLTVAVDLPAPEAQVLTQGGSPEGEPSSAAAATGTGAAKLAVAAISSGAEGDWSATSLSPSAAWSTSGSTGGFTWSYPMRVPEVPGGLIPQVGLSYSSASSDGRIASTNNQASWVGEGFELTSSYIERKYLSCDQDDDTDDGRSANNANTKAYDLCWGTDNATLVLNGQALELVVGAGGKWRPKDDDGTRIERKTYRDTPLPDTRLPDTRLPETGEEDDDGEYWVVTTGDGLRYVFGANAAGDDASHSTWTVPVFGNHSKEKCNEASFASSGCRQAWRWNLRSVTDRSGNTMTYSYARERAAYRSMAADKKVFEYDTGGRLTTIEYGMRAGTSAAGTARVVFEAAMRCRESAGTCDRTKMHANPRSWPDLPADLYCAPGSTTSQCSDQQVSPVFFTAFKLVQVRTEAFDGSALQPVDAWALGSGFVAPEGRTSSSQSTGEILQLNSVVHTGFGGKGGTGKSLPPVKLEWKAMENRVDELGDGASPMMRPRLETIRSESGALTKVVYKTGCTPGEVKDLVPSKNTKLCFPVNWQPEGQTEHEPDWFHKYVVDSITDSGASVSDRAGGLVTGSDPVTTRYDYTGASWAKPVGSLVDPKQITYSEFRGHSSVTTVVGTGTDESETTTRYLQGLKSEGAWHTRLVGPPDHQVEVTDDDRLVGMAYSTEQYNGSRLVSQTVTAPQVEASMAAADTDQPSAHRVSEISTSTFTFTKAGAFEREARSTTRFDADSRPMSTDDHGDLAVSGDELCTAVTYREPITTDSDVILFGLVKRSETVAKACGADGAQSAADVGRPKDVVSDTLTEYDDHGRVIATWQVRPNLNPATDTLNPSDHTGYYRVNAVTEYDGYGRALGTVDAAGRSTTTDYPTPEGRQATVVVTSPPPSGSGAGFSTTTTYDRVTGNVLKQLDVNNKPTTAAYDELGRLLAVRYPQHVGSGPASVAYSYAVNETGLNSVTTRTLGADGVTRHLSSVIYDGLMRVIQTQTESKAVASPTQGATARGRVVSHTFYDTAGRVATQWGPWTASGVPSGTPIVTPTSVDALSTYRYDAAGRQTDEIVWNTTPSNPAHEHHRTVTVYDGSHTSVIPPTGGTATTTVSDARGRTVQLTEYETLPTMKVLLDGSSSVPGFDARQSTGGVVSVSYAYDVAGNLVKVTDSGANAAESGDENSWLYTYDLAGRQVVAQDPDSGTTRTTYDLLGQVRTVTNGKGQKLTYDYDDLGRKVSSSDAAGVRTSFAYDTAKDAAGNVVKGQLASSTRWVAGEEYRTQVLTYDEAYRPLSTKVTLPAVGALASLTNRSFVTDYTYTADGQVETVGLPEITKNGASGGARVLGGETVTTYFDAASMPQWMAGGFGWGTYVAESRHDWAGRATAVDLGNTYGAVVSYRYDPVTAQLTGLALDREQIDGSDLAVTYKHDDAGNLERAWDRPTNTALGATRQDNQCFSYDGLRRLTRAWTATTDAADCPTESVTSSLVGGASKYWTSWEYDDLGNRVKQIDHTTATTTEYGHGPQPDGGYAGPHAMTSTTVKIGSTAPKSATYAYDQAGRQTVRGSAGQTLVWDVESELTSVKTETSTTASFVYDANGDRLTRSDSTGTTVYLPGGQEILVTSTGVKSATRYYTFDGQTVAVRTKNGLSGVTSLVNDPHGTTLAAVPNTNWTNTSVIKRYTTPFGALRGSSDAVPGDRQFLNKAKDATGLTMIGARYYDDAHGRFLSVDPVMDLTDPQQWNGYAYSNNNPTTWSDPTGLIINMPRPDTDVYSADGDTAPGSSGSRTQDGQGETAAPVASVMAQVASDRSYELMMQWLASGTGQALILNSSNVVVGTKFMAARFQTFMSMITRSTNVISGITGGVAALTSRPSMAESAAMADMATLIAMFHPGGEWDAKPYLARELGVGSGEGQAYYVPTGSGLEIRADVYGNYQYGYMMSRFGYSVEQATDASHVSSVAGNPDPADDLAIRLGYGLAERYPSGPTGIEFFRHLVAGEHLGEMLKVKAGRLDGP